MYALYIVRICKLGWLIFYEYAGYKKIMLIENKYEYNKNKQSLNLIKIFNN